MNVYETLSAIQTELSAPKGQFNKFGGYAYRSCEDILEALKPLLKKYKACVTINDEIVTVGDRFYIKATAALHAEGETVTAAALAREALDKKGMDSAQVTGSTSSYARKYALNGLFAIDDNKDPDDPQSAPPAPKATQAAPATPPKTPQKPKTAAPVQENAAPHAAPPEASVSHTAPAEPPELDYVVPTGKWAGYKLRDLYKNKGRQYVIAEYQNPESGEKFKKAVEAVEAFIAAKGK